METQSSLSTKRNPLHVIELVFHIADIGRCVRMRAMHLFPRGQKKGATKFIARAPSNDTNGFCTFFIFHDFSLAVGLRHCFLYLEFKKKGEKGAKGAKTFSNAPRAAVLDAPFSRGQKKGARDAPVT